MKKVLLSKFFITLMMVNVLSVGLMSFSNQNMAYAVEAEAEEADIDPGTIAALASAAISATVGLFCPKTPVNRCKSGSCQSGACISFREACYGATGSSCGGSNDSAS
jgi:hypothetical protein